MALAALENNDYREDLAHIHDVGFGGFPRSSAPALLEMLKSHGIAGGLVVDLGCGSGIWARALCEAGYDVLGVDQSRAMVNLARTHAPRARFVAGSFLDAKIPVCEAVTSLGECFNYLSDRTNGIARLRGLFRRIYRALRPGGLLIFDIAEPGRGKGPRLKHLEGTGWAILLEVDEDERSRRLTRRITTFRRIGKLYRRDEEMHRLQLYRRSQIAGELRRVGFRVRIVTGYGQQRFPKAYAGFLARKPGLAPGRSSTKSHAVSSPRTA
ncbi:MAG TPA: class I SAM-dependent methyltransferase [Acidobacteriota bacterium]|nr:class I SAM-dependent methyltransferase [Acidobacteriota bacterium]